VENSPAQKAGLKVFDEIIGFGDADGGTISVSTAREVREYIAANAGKEISLVIQRDSQTEVKAIILPKKEENNGLLGIVPARTGLLSYPWYESLWRGLEDAVFLTGQTAVGYYELFKTLLLKGQLLAEVSGPIGIANVTGQAAAVGFRFLLQFVALISVNLAVLNIIPFPVLDGGRALLLIVEKLKGSPVNSKVEAAINSVGFILLILLMIYTTIKDVGRIF
jgi:regulator of sigma E protease